jgi:hypothetical protein
MRSTLISVLESRGFRGDQDHPRQWPWAVFGEPGRGDVSRLRTLAGDAMPTNDREFT